MHLRHEEAAEAFEAAVLFEVEPIPALVNLGVIQMRIGQCNVKQHTHEVLWRCLPCGGGEGRGEG